MSEKDDHKAALLDFLTDNIVGRERDAVTRAFYEYAEGDPHSHPVGMAILLIACARQMARLPENVRFGLTELQTLVAKVVQVEQDLLEKLARENHSTHSAIKEEAAQLLAQLRTELSDGVGSIMSGSRDAKREWEEVVKTFGSALSQGQKIQVELGPIVSSAQNIARDFHAIKIELKLRDDSDKKILDAVTSLKVVHEESKAIHRESKAIQQDVLLLLKSAVRDGRAHWTTIGLVAGLALANTASQLPWWGDWLSFIGAIVLLQWLPWRGWRQKG